jgi:hypothetical protein
MGVYSVLWTSSPPLLYFCPVLSPHLLLPGTSDSSEGLVCLLTQWALSPNTTTAAWGLSTALYTGVLITCHIRHIQMQHVILTANDMTAGRFKFLIHKVAKWWNSKTAEIWVQLCRDQSSTLHPCPPPADPGMEAMPVMSSCGCLDIVWLRLLNRRGL